MTDTDLTLLSDLPPTHKLRNKPLEGARFRVWCEKGGDITVPFSERGEDWVYMGWSAWKEVKPSWVIAKFKYNDLGDSWIKNKQWSFDK